jgi:peptide/nickel transport system substrate-binding protein/oligopeptide transport system substrate-binding protein
MNYLYKPLDNIHIRQALAAAINRDALDRAIYQGSHLPTCHIVPPGTPDYKNTDFQCPAGTPTSGDAAKARALFNQGLQEEHLTAATFPAISLAYPNNSATMENEAQAIIQMWQSTLGITIKTQSFPYSTFLNNLDNTACTQNNKASCLNHGLSMWLIGYLEDYPDPQDWTGLQFGKEAGINNAQNYGQNLCSCVTEQQQTQQLMERADSDLGSDRFALYYQIEQQLVNDVAWLSIDQGTNSYLLRTYITGFSYNIANEIPPDDWGHIYVMEH